MDARQIRIGENEALFRQVNERVKQLNVGFSAVLEYGEFVCECGDEKCTERVRLTPEEYERVRADPTHFVVTHGHVAPDVEEVVFENERYQVVRKHPGGPADLAAQRDPRT
jgi:hypothetical protein